MKKLFIILAVFLGIAVVIIAGAGLYLTRGLEDGKALVIEDIAVNTIKDGTYTGNYKAGRFSNQIEVTITNHKITAINSLKDVTFSQPNLAQQLFEQVIQKQSLQVDILSGATVTSKAYLKAMENALKVK